MKRELSVDKNCKNSESVLNELKLGYINLEDGLFKIKCHFIQGHCEVKGI